MGARRSTSFNGRPPLTVSGGDLHADHLSTRHAERPGQDRRAAGRTADAAASPRSRSPPATRDHTERAPAGLWRDGRRPADYVDPHRGRQPLTGRHVAVPGDPSSAAFWACAAAALPGSFLELRDVGLNPSRTAIFDVLRRLGADVDLQVDRIDAEEPVGRVRVRHRRLRRLELTPADVPGPHRRTAGAGRARHARRRTAGHRRRRTARQGKRPHHRARQRPARARRRCRRTARRLPRARARGGCSAARSMRPTTIGWRWPSRSRASARSSRPSSAAPTPSTCPIPGFFDVLAALRK